MQIEKRHITCGIKNCRDSRLFKGCSPLLLLCNLTGNSPKSATKTYRQPLPTILKKNLTAITPYHNLYLNLYAETYKINNIMLTTTISDFRKDIKQYLDRVTENFETLIINRGKDSGVVIMSLDEYNSLNATYHELSSKTNEKRLDSAIEKLKTGSSFQKDLL